MVGPAHSVWEADGKMKGGPWDHAEAKVSVEVKVGQMRVDKAWGWCCHLLCGPGEGGLREKAGTVPQTRWVWGALETRGEAHGTHTVCTLAKGASGLSVSIPNHRTHVHLPVMGPPRLRCSSPDNRM